MNQLFGCLGSANGGVFSRADAISSGETDQSLAQARRAGLVVRLRRGMYVDADVYAACEDSGRHLLHARAALAAQHGDVVLTGASAAALHGFALYDQDLATTHLLRLDGGAGRRAAQTSHHHQLPPVTEGEIGVFDGVRAVTPARAVWEVACMSSLEGAVVTADAALHLDPVLAAALEELRPRFARVRGSRTARLALHLADDRAESAGESVTRVQFYRFGIPLPEPQFEVHDESGRLVGRADFGWDKFRHLGEFDGNVKYQKFLRPGESVTDCVIREKRREDEMRAESHGMSRFVWASIMPSRVARTMAELGQSLQRSRRLYVPVGVSLSR